MNITILAVGSRGDVQPLIALGQGLQGDGHEVCMATHAVFEKVNRDCRLGFSLIQANPQEALESESGRASMEGGRNPLRSLLQFVEMLRPYFLQACADSLAACQDAEAILYSPVAGYVAPSIAERMRVPAIAAYLQPQHRTRAYPGFMSLTPRNLGGFLNQMTHIIGEIVYWQPYRPLVNQCRQELLDLPPIPRRVNAIRNRQRRMPTIYGFSPSVLPKPPDWGSHVEITGYWFLDTPADWHPPWRLG